MKQPRRKSPSKAEPKSAPVQESWIDELKKNEPVTFKSVLKDATQKTSGHSMLRYILFSLMILILFTWMLVNIHTLMDWIRKFLSLISPFLVGCAIAYVLNVVLRPLERLWNSLWRKSRSSIPKKLCRPVCMIISTLLVLGILFAVIFLIIPGLSSSIGTLIDSIPAYVREVNSWWRKLVAAAEQYHIHIPEVILDSEKIQKRITSFLSQEGTGILNATLNATTSIISSVFNTALSLVFALYLLAQKEEISLQMKKLTFGVLPVHKAKRLLDITRLVNQTFASFISGQLTEACILGILCFIGMLCFRMPYAGVIAVLISFTALIPVFGAFIGAGIGAFLILLISPVKAFWFLIFILILQQLENNLIYPKVVGKSVGLPGILVLLAVTIGGNAFGVVGMLLGVPMTAVLYALYKEYIDVRISRKVHSI